jgi:hypothetical protein
MTTAKKGEFECRQHGVLVTSILTASVTMLRPTRDMQMTATTLLMMQQRSAFL